MGGVTKPKPVRCQLCGELVWPKALQSCARCGASVCPRCYVEEGWCCLECADLEEGPSHA